MSFQSFQIIDDLSVGELMDYEDCLDLFPDFLPETTSQPSVTTISRLTPQFAPAATTTTYWRPKDILVK
ncbi:847_t:CDS:2 [Paraglomus occultum]|uniref:847_t:CDS:1 n=1 Tax=Paraglomus occultum TaxID=144539 RepID=A0A9N9CKB3_9GLOM|nr:847_t:CDS:2 [Paraglomus occultum]